jgi:predicted dinucleotide-binding enzyme
LESEDMKIGVIGIGEMGGTLARRWVAKGHSVRVANSRGAEAVREFAAGIGAEPADIYGAVEGADVILLAMAYPAVAQLPKDLFNRVGKDVPVIDVSNYYPEVRDKRIPEVDAGTPESVWISRQLGRPIFKAFNSVMAHTLSELDRPAGSEERLAIPVAGDDGRGKQIVMQLVDDIGFDPVDGGSLEESWRQQPSTPTYACDYNAPKTEAGIRAAVKGKAEALRDGAWRQGYFKIYSAKPSHAEAHAAVIAMNRSLNPF